MCGFRRRSGLTGLLLTAAILVGLTGELIPDKMGFVDAASITTTWLGVTRPGFSAHVSSLGFVYRF